MRTYNSYGGHSTLSLLAPFFHRDLPDFGPALQEIGFTFTFAHPGPPNRSLGNLFETFHEGLGKLPKVAFHRSRESASIDILSTLMNGADLGRFGELRLDWFKAGAEEMVAALELLRPRFRSSDHFDFGSFLHHCRGRVDLIPSTQVDFELLAKELELWEKQQRDSQSPWEKLGIDFRDFHPRSREILDDPFFWDCVDDFSPHGNDTGADLLEDYRSWLQKDPDGDPLHFLDRLLESWGLEGDALVSDQAAIALAFAELKIRGSSSTPVIRKALNAIQNQLKAVPTQNDDPISVEWTGALRRMDQKLTAASSGYPSVAKILSPTRKSG